MCRGDAGDGFCVRGRGRACARRPEVASSGHARGYRRLRAFVASRDRRQRQCHRRLDRERRHAQSRARRATAGREQCLAVAGRSLARGSRRVCTADRLRWSGQRDCRVGRVLGHHRGRRCPPFIAESAFRPAVSGVWQAPVELPTPPVTDTPRIALDAQGDVMALALTQFGAQTTFRPAATGDWQQPVAIDGGPPTQIAFDAQGNAFAVRVISRDGGQSYVVQASLRPALTGVWQPPVDISAADPEDSATQFPHGPQIAIDPDGNALAIWTAGRPGIGFAVQTALRPAP